MAYKMTKRGSIDNEVTYEFFCDTVADMESIKNIYRCLGSIAIVLEGDSGGLEIYITNSSKEWIPLDISTGNGSENSGGGSNLPTAPVANGTYNLQVTVNNGTATYSWVQPNALEINT